MNEKETWAKQPNIEHKHCRKRMHTTMGSSDGWGRAKGWTNKANCMPQFVKRSAVQGICQDKERDQVSDKNQGIKHFTKLS